MMNRQTTTPATQNILPTLRTRPSALRSSAWVLATMMAVASCDDDSTRTKAAAPTEQVAPSEHRVVMTVGSRAQELTDTDVAYAVRNRLNDLGDKTHAIDVKAKAGVVTLAGTVPTLAVANRAAQAATFIVGVRHVDATIEVVARPIGDDELASRAENALARAPATATSKIDVSAKNGAVVLKGAVDSFQEKRAAEQAVASIAGVMQIENLLTVDVGAERSDAEIEADVESALTWDALLASNLIEVQVVDGAITLSGAVRSLGERRRAAELAWVGGAKSVHAEGLGIMWWKYDEATDLTPPSVVDDEVAAVVERRLLLDPRVPHGQVDVVAKNDVIIVSGAVPTHAAKRAIDDIVAVLRLSAVQNNVEVVADPIADEVLVTELGERIAANPWVDAADVNVEVKDGRVVLMGRVDTSTELFEAELAVAEHAAVVDIDNRLRVEGLSPTPPSDEDLATAIDNALTYDPSINAEGVRIEVREGHVVLVGTVDAPTRKRAMQAAHDAGAATVDATKLIAL